MKIILIIIATNSLLVASLCIFQHGTALITSPEGVVYAGYYLLNIIVFGFCINSILPN